MATDERESSIAANLKNFRGRLAWTQAQLAEASGISERTVQRAEDGASVGAETLSALAGALNVSIGDLRNAPKAEQDLSAKYRVINLVRIARASDFRGLVPADALQVGYDSLS
jgi:transcriptional regulator with XRE-family HTH domain